jgi:hypothetical protein
VLAFWAKISEGARCWETKIPPSTFAFLPSVSFSRLLSLVLEMVKAMVTLFSVAFSGFYKARVWSL